MKQEDLLLRDSNKTKYDAISTTELGTTPQSDVPLLGSFRLSVSVSCMFLTTLITLHQESMTAAIVCMLPGNGSVSDIENGRSSSSNYSSNTINDSSMDLKPYPWSVHWDKKTESWIVSAHFAGYFLIQLPSGYLVNRFGPKLIALYGLLVSSLLQTLAVVLLFQSVGILLAIRFITGIHSGLMYGAAFDMMSRWTPRHETSILFGVVGAGLDLGQPLCFIMSLIASTVEQFQGGWPIIFYIQGCMGLLLFVFICLFLSDTPKKNRFASTTEVVFIEETRAPRKRTRRIPMGSIMRSTVVWAALISQLGTDWMANAVMTQFPLYYKLIIGLSVTKVNILESGPMFMVIVSICISGYVADRCIKKRLLSRTSTRKIFDGTAKIIYTIVCLGLCFLPRGSFGAAIVLNAIMAVALGVTCGAGYIPNQCEIGPAYTAFICGFCQTGAMWAAVVVPILFGHLTVHNTIGEWRLCLLISAGIALLSCLFFSIFGSGEIQPWALDKEKTDHNIPIDNKK